VKNDNADVPEIHSPAIFVKVTTISICLFLTGALFLVPPVFTEVQGEEEISAREDAPVYSLEELLRIALVQAEKIRISEEDLFIAERGKDKALSALLPTFSAYGDYTRYTEEKEFSTSFGSFSVQPENSSQWGVRLDQTISLGGTEVRNYQISKKEISLSMYDLDAVKEDYLLSVTKRYFDVLKARKAIEIAKANVQRLSKYRDDSHMRLKVGEVTKTVLLRAEAELSGAESDLVKVNNLHKLAKAILSRSVGIPGEYSLREVHGNDIAAEGIEESLELLKQTAFSQRPEMGAGKVQQTIAADQVSAARGAYWPTLSLEGVYAKRDEDPSSTFFNDESIYGVLRLNFPFFEGGLRRAEVREAEARKRQAELQYEDIKKTIGVEVEEAFLNIMTQSGILESLRNQFSFAKENFRMVSKQFEYGLADSLDVMDANNLLVTSERDLARAQYDYQYAVYQLQRATGGLQKNFLAQTPEDPKGESELDENGK
jgi:outer membrane protein